MAYADQADLEAAVGGPNGAAVLRQLLSATGATVADPAMVTRCLEESCSELNSALQIKVDTIANQPPYEPLLVRLNAVFAGELAHTYGSGGQEMPPVLVKNLEWARKQLDLFVAGKRSLGMSPQGALNQTVGVVDFDRHGTGISIDAFKRGFR